MSRTEIDVLKGVLPQLTTDAQRRSLKQRLARRQFELSYEQQRFNPQESLALAWESLRTDPRPAATRRLIASALQRFRTPLISNPSQDK